MGMNHPSVEASDLTIEGEFMPHTTSLKKKRQVKGVEGGDVGGIEGKRSEELWNTIQSER
jgi:hypothetical protein